MMHEQLEILLFMFQSDAMPISQGFIAERVLNITVIISYLFMKFSTEYQVSKTEATTGS